MNSRPRHPFCLFARALATDPIDESEFPKVTKIDSADAVFDAVLNGDNPVDYFTQEYRHLIRFGCPPQRRGNSQDYMVASWMGAYPITTTLLIPKPGLTPLEWGEKIEKIQAQAELEGKGSLIAVPLEEYEDEDWKGFLEFYRERCPEEDANPPPVN